MSKNLENIVNELLKVGLAFGEKLEKELKEAKQEPEQPKRNPIDEFVSQFEAFKKKAEADARKAQESKQSDVKTEATETKSPVFDETILKRFNEPDMIMKVMADLFGKHQPAQEEVKESSSSKEAFETEEIVPGVFDVKSVLLQKQEYLRSRGFHTRIEEGYYDAEGHRILNPHVNYDVLGFYKASLFISASKDDVLFVLDGYGDGSFVGQEISNSLEADELKRDVARAKQDLSTALLVNMPNQDLVNETTKLNRAIFALQEAETELKNRQLMIEHIKKLLQTK